MSLIACADVSIAFGAVTILSGLDLRIESRDRLAIVGGNGAGKSSLLDVLAGVQEPSAGRVERERTLITAYLPQDAPPPSAATVLAEAMASRVDIAALRTEMEGLEVSMAAGGPDLERVLDRYGVVQHAYEGLGGYDLEARARAALHGLGLPEAEQARHPRELSGGQIRRLELAKLLLQDADLLLVDEPTNHLDLSAIEWLEDFLRTAPCALVVVSHDRRFIDDVCTRVLELSHGVGEEFPGNYTQYVRLRGERRERRRKEYETQQGFISHQEEFIRRYKAGQRARQARGRQTLLDRLDRVAPVLEDQRPRLRFRTAPMSGVLLRMRDVDAGRGAALVHHSGGVVGPGDRVAIVGPNGSGKSTLLHTLAGELDLIGGEILPGARLRMRLYRQDHGHLDGARTVLEELLADHPIGEESGRSMLGTLLFEGDDVFTSVGDLSGGERARLALGKLALEDTNLLLLDEPTNHLDIPAQEVLEESIQQYPGGIVLVSHDRALIDAVATRVWAVEEAPAGAHAPHRVREVLGGYADLLRARERERLGLPEGAGGRPAPEPQKPNGGSARRGTPADRKIEADIATLESRLAAARERLLDPATFSSHDAGAEAGREYDRLAAELGALYDRWAEASD